VEDKKLRIAIDGPGGSGKSTLARGLAADLGLDYIDTGAMYRAIGMKLDRLGIPIEESDVLRKVLDETHLNFEGGKIYLDGEDVTDEIRSQKVSMLASACSALPSTRKKLVSLQREMARSGNVVMDGRDIGTNVMPDAEYKFFVTASPEERARRRCKELVERGETPDFDEVLEETRKRDMQDSTRELNPLSLAKDAVLLDTSDMDASMALEEIKSFIGESRP
jgi:cytidylate kinase